MVVCWDQKQKSKRSKRKSKSTTMHERLVHDDSLRVNEHPYRDANIGSILSKGLNWTPYIYIHISSMCDFDDFDVLEAALRTESSAATPSVKKTSTATVKKTSTLNLQAATVKKTSTATSSVRKVSPPP